MPKNLNDLTPIEACYRASSYLSDYAGILANHPHYRDCADLLYCVRQSAQQLEGIAQVFEAIQAKHGKMPPVMTYR